MMDITTLTMTDIIRLQNQLQQELTRRFECSLALMFSDIVGSTAYFARFGDAAGRQLQQLHVDLLSQHIVPHGGRIVDTAGDGAFLVFPSVTLALEAMAAFQNGMANTNTSRAREHQLATRTGMHWGLVLSDGVAVSGDAVNLCARVASTAQAGQVRITRAFYRELGSHDRLKCRSLGTASLKGFAEAVEMFELDWRDRSVFPNSIYVEETDEHWPLPQQDIVAFGRVLEHNGLRANDFALTHPNPDLQRHISRWQFELRRTDRELRLFALSDSATFVDGERINRGDSVAVRAGSIVRVANALTLQLLGPQALPSGMDVSSTMLYSAPATPSS